MKRLFPAVLLFGVFLFAAVEAAVDPAGEKNLLPVVLFGGQHMGEVLAPRRLEKGKRTEFALYAVKIPRETVSARITFTWVDRDYRNRGFLAFADPEILKLDPAAGPERKTFSFVIPEREELRGVQLNISFLDGSGRGLGSIDTSPLFLSTLPERTPPVRDFYRDETGNFVWHGTFASRSAGGMLSWQPLPPEEPPMREVRYIDYEAGDDGNDGLSAQRPWKHHPWDVEASGRAAEDRTGLTYLFKRGAIYRGAIRGTAEKAFPPGGERIFLSSSATYGKGERAWFFNSFPVNGKWEKTGRENVYATRLDTHAAQIGLYCRNGEELRPYVLARHPNIRLAGRDDLRSDWFCFERTGREGGMFAGHAEALCGVPGQSDLENALLWTDFDAMMAFPLATRIRALDRESGKISALPIGFPVHRGCRFYLADSLEFLDEPGEFYYDRKSHRLYVMPRGGEEELAKLEYSDRMNAFAFDGMRNFAVSNLGFKGGCDRKYDSSIWLDITHRPASLRMVGCGDFEVANCRFEYVPGGVTVTSGGFHEIASGITVRDCDFDFSSSSGIRFDEGIFSYVKILRNRVRNSGFVIPMYPAVALNVGRVAVIAGNVIDRCGGIGIDTVWGKDARGEISLDSAPLIRGMIFQNQVTDALLLLNDYGNIEMWNSGPVYIFDNVSVDPGGIWHPSYVRTPPEKQDYGSSRFGFAYYLDGGFKGYIFNNIAAGKNNRLGSLLCNTAAFQEIYGFQNSYFNNRVFRFGAAFRRQLPEGGRNLYAGNLMEDISDVFFDFDGWRQSMKTLSDACDYTTNILSGNVFSGSPRRWGVLDYKGENYLTLKDLAAELKKRAFAGSMPGKMAEHKLFADPEKGDFRLSREAEAEKTGAGTGVKVFVPWGLANCACEWEFRRPAEGVDFVPDASFPETDEHFHRSMYLFVPKSDLRLHHLGTSDFTAGEYDDALPSVLVFNGVKGYARADDRAAKRDMRYRFRTFTKDYTANYPGAKRQGADMGRENFIIELIFRGKTGTILSKEDGVNGYSLRLENGRRVELRLLHEGRVFQAAAELPESADTPKLRHLLLEIDRKTGAVNFYFEGKKLRGDVTGKLPPFGADVANASDLLVGRDAAGKDHFSGALDYLRLARTTLEESGCSIGELYDWEFSGPSQRR